MITMVRTIEKKESPVAVQIKQLEVDPGKARASHKVAPSLKDKEVTQLQ